MKNNGLTANASQVGAQAQQLTACEVKPSSNNSNNSIKTNTTMKKNIKNNKSENTNMMSNNLVEGKDFEFIHTIREQIGNEMQKFEIYHMTPSQIRNHEVKKSDKGITEFEDNEGRLVSMVFDIRGHFVGQSFLVGLINDAASVLLPKIEATEGDWRQHYYITRYSYYLYLRFILWGETEEGAIKLTQKTLYGDLHKKFTKEEIENWIENTKYDIAYIQ